MQVKKKKANVIVTINIEFVWTCLDKQSFECVWVLNIPDIVHRLRSLYNILSISSDRVVVENFVRQLRWKIVEE